MGDYREVAGLSYAAEIAALLARSGFRRFAMSRSPVGHVMLAGNLDGRPIDIVLDTGASKTFVELTYCRSARIPVTDTWMPGHGGNVYTLGDVSLNLDGLALRTDGIFAIDMTGTNERLRTRGVAPICAVIGQDVLRHHQAVIDYATLSLYLAVKP